MRSISPGRASWSPGEEAFSAAGSSIGSRNAGPRPIVVRSAEYDLTEPERVRAALQESRPDYVIHAAAVVGGIGANRERPGEFFYANAVMGVHLIHEAWKAGIRKLLIVGNRLLVSQVHGGALPRRRPLERLPGGDERALRAREEDAPGASAGLS